MLDLRTTSDHLAPSGASSPVPVEGEVVGDDGELAGGLILFLDDGALSSLEVYSYSEPLPLPAPDHVRWIELHRRDPANPTR